MTAAATTDADRATARMPTLFLSHGAPPLADDPVWTRQLANWSASLPPPAAILIVSAHWENAPLTVGAIEPVPLVEMYPRADVPVLQISMPSLDPEVLLEVGRRLAPLRDQGVLIIGSGFTTHNLGELDPAASHRDAAPSWSVEFDDWVDRTVALGDVDALLDFLRKAPAALRAHPRTEHFAPLFVALGASLELVEATSVVDGFWCGLSKRSFQFH